MAQPRRRLTLLFCFVLVLESKFRACRSVIRRAEATVTAASSTLLRDVIIVGLAQIERVELDGNAVLLRRCL